MNKYGAMKDGSHDMAYGKKPDKAYSGGKKKAGKATEYSGSKYAKDATVVQSRSRKFT